MNCLQIDRYIFDYCDHILSPELQVLFEEHLAKCEICRKKVELTCLENEVLKDQNIPTLNPDFTSNILQAIKSNSEIIPLYSEGDISDRVKRRFEFKIPDLFLTSAIIAVVLVCALLIPGVSNMHPNINMADNNGNTKLAGNETGTRSNQPGPADEEQLSYGQQTDKMKSDGATISAKSNPEKETQLNNVENIDGLSLEKGAKVAPAQGLMVADKSSAEARDTLQNETPMKASKTAEQEAGATPNGDLADEVMAGHRSQEMEVDAPPNEALKGAGIPVEQESDALPNDSLIKTGNPDQELNTAKLMETDAGAPPPNSDILSLYPSKLPEDYQLLQIISKSEDKLTYLFQDSKANQQVVLNISRLPEEPRLAYVDENDDAEDSKSIRNEVGVGRAAIMEEDYDDPAGTEPSDAFTSENYTLSWDINHNEQNYRVSITANMSPEDLAQIASLIEFKEEIIDDQN